MSNQVIEKFKEIRDTPYSIPLSDEEEDVCCSGKNKMLKVYLESIGYKVRWRVGRFRWGEVGLPKDILDLIEDDLEMHAWLEFYIEDEWRAVDATWDKGLSSVFHINEWDGETATEVGVPLLKTFSPEKSEEIMEAGDDDFTEQEERFFKAINQWLKEVRQEAGSEK